MKFDVSVILLSSEKSFSENSYDNEAYENPQVRLHNIKSYS